MMKGCYTFEELQVKWLEDRVLKKHLESTGLEGIRPDLDGRPLNHINFF